MTLSRSDAFAAALAGFRGMNLSRLRALLRHHDPERAFAVATGDLPPSGLIAKVFHEDPELLTRWRHEATRRSPDAVGERCEAIGVRVVVHGAPDYPDLLRDDTEAPPVLFVQGDLGMLDGRRAAIVGTRNATGPGRHMATQLGLELAVAGVHIVSGLARGVDGCAHRGALNAAATSVGAPVGRPIGVVACGHDVVYPPEHRELWRQVGETGLLLSEHPPGSAPEAHRFPLRNRIVAALSEVVVVVESRERGGSLITVEAASQRGIPVMAVPGGVHSRASTGTNLLLRDGSAPVLDPGDVLVAMALQRRGAPPVSMETRARPLREDVAAYEACAAEPRTVEGVALATGSTLIDAAMALARLEQAGWLAHLDGWFE
ncbi:unnamed protein product, partial [Phaeothamnion confervicola]